ncbi:MAG: hypothetical protein JNJ46_12580 [Myxococcales bacterium]|nr:hypothetical protein [Myxococcales bacterium]
MPNRLTRYRAFNARLGLTSAASALEQNHYVKRPGQAAADQIASHMELSPTSVIALVGGIGSGKTTALLVAMKQLIQAEDTRAVYVDVGQFHDLQRIETGVIVAAVGLALCKLVDKSARDSLNNELQRAIQSFRQWAEPQEEWIPYDELALRRMQKEEEDSFVRVKEPGKLTLPNKLSDELESQRKNFAMIREAYASAYLIGFIDGLDRLASIEQFQEAIDEDLRFLQAEGLGLVVTAPLLSLFGKYRTALSRFEHIIVVHPVDISGPRGENEFLCEVLKTRDPDGVLSSEAREILARDSGGVLRDLLALAKAAARNAYMLGRDTVTGPDVLVASDQLARTLFLGLGDDDLKVLQRIRKQGSFVTTSDRDLALLMTRRVLEYPQADKPPRFAVHPTMLPLLHLAVDSP